MAYNRPRREKERCIVCLEEFCSCNQCWTMTRLREMQSRDLAQLLVECLTGQLPEETPLREAICSILLQREFVSHLV